MSYNSPMINRIFLILTTVIASGTALCPAADNGGGLSADNELGRKETVTADVMAHLMMLK